MPFRTIIKIIGPIVAIGIVYSGFIFGFSAIFPDDIDVTTAYAGPLRSQRAMLMSKEEIEELRVELSE